MNLRSTAASGQGWIENLRQRLSRYNIGGARCESLHTRIPIMPEEIKPGSSNHRTRGGIDQNFRTNGRRVT
jgi:hypothetical protein